MFTPVASSSIPWNTELFLWSSQQDEQVWVKTHSYSPCISLKMKSFGQPWLCLTSRSWEALARNVIDTRNVCDGEFRCSSKCVWEYSVQFECHFKSSGKKGIMQWYDWKALSACVGRGKSGHIPSSLLYQRKFQLEKVRKEVILEGRREKEPVKQDIKFSPIRKWWEVWTGSLVCGCGCV